MKKHEIKQKIKNAAFNYVLMMITSIIILYFVEAIYYRDFSKAIQFLAANEWLGVVLINLCLIYLIEVMIYMLSGNVTISFLVVSVLCYSVAIVNDLKMSVRGEAVTLGDVSALKEALRVAGNYELSINDTCITVIIWTIILIGILSVFIPKPDKEERRRSKWKPILVIVIFAVFWGNITYFIKAAGGEKYVFVTEEYYNKHGLLAGFAKTTPKSVQAPKEYSRKKVAEIENGVEIKEGGKSPNLIFIMNESLYDIVSVEGLPLSQDPLIKLKELEKKYTNGKFVSSQLGGGTCNVEFEVLTGCSIDNVGGANVMPYPDMINEDIGSLAGLMDKNGYYTVAFHSNTGKYYNRRNVYKYMGFQKIKFTEEMGEFSREGIYASDRELYQKVIEEFEGDERGDKPFFSYVITMQNHGGYDYDYDGCGIRALDSDEYTDKQQLETYANLECSSIEALEWFLNYFDKIREPTVVVMFGDHAPSFELFGYKIKEKGIERLGYYLTPLLVYSNYELPYEEWGYVNGYNLAAKVLDYCDIKTDAFWSYAVKEDNVPTFGNYYYLDNKWEKSDLVDERYTGIKDKLWLLAYDRIFGKRYGEHYE